MILRRYLIRELVHQMLIMLMVLLIIMVSVIFVRYLSDAADGGMSLTTVVSMIGVILPQYIALLIPVSFFLSIILVYGKLFADSELLVMFACGLSWRDLARYTLWPGVLLSIVVGFLSLYIMPIMNYYQDNLAEISKQRANSLSMVETGRFIGIHGGNEVVYLGSSDPHTQRSQDIFIYRQLNGAQAQIILAPEGYMQRQAGGQSLVLVNGRSYQGVPTQQNWQLVQFKQYSAVVSQPISLGQNTDLKAKIEKRKKLTTCNGWLASKCHTGSSE